MRFSLKSSTGSTMPTSRNARASAKSFQAPVGHPSLNLKLFRANISPVVLIPSINALQIRPVFDALSYECGPDVDQRYLFYRLDNELDTTPLKAITVASEYATSPPVTIIRLKLHAAPIVETRNKTGVTVLQVMQAVARAFGKPSKHITLYEAAPWLVGNQGGLGDIPD